jgi:hypothetical protein
VVVVTLVSAGCDANTPTYYAGPRVLEVGGQVNGMDRPGTDSVTFDFPIRTPTGPEQRQLAADTQRLGFMVPWVQRASFAIEISYTVHNLDNKPGTADVSVDGADEFTSYDSAAIRAALQMTMMKNQQAVLPLIQAVPFIVPAGHASGGLVREDDFAEAELDLDAIGRWMAPPDAVLINRSEVNPIGLEQVPKTEVVPAFIRVVVSFEADTHMTCEFALRVRDGGARLWDGSGARYNPMPMTYTPPVMATN